MGRIPRRHRMSSGLLCGALLGLVGPSLHAAVGGSYTFQPTTFDAGGHAQSSTAYQQYAGSFGGIASTAAVSTAYHGRQAYVAQLPETTIVEFSDERYVITRRADGIVVPVVRDRDEDRPISVTYQVSDSGVVDGDKLTPTSGTVTFNDGETLSVPVPLALQRQVDQGATVSFLVTLGAPDGEAAVGARSTARIIVRPEARSDGKRRPLIVSQASLATLSGDQWSYDLVVDVSGVQLPHSLTLTYALEFRLLEGPPGMVLTPLGTDRARLSWHQSVGADDHHPVRLQVIDTMTGLCDWQNVLLYVVQRPQGGG